MQNILVLLADWANGLFALLIASGLTDTELFWWHVPIALLLSHLPDVDAISELLQRGRVSASAEHVRDHRTFLHFPIISLPLSFASVFLFGFWGWVIFLSMILHLLNDLYGTGWGIPLFWPVTKRRYKLFGRRANRMKSMLVADGDWQVLSVPEKKFRVLVSWSSEELAKYTARWGMDNWIERYYLQLNWISVSEYSLFLASCVLLLIHLF